MYFKTLLLLAALFTAAMLPAQIRHIDLKTGKMCFLDAKGALVVPLDYDYLPWKYAPRMIARKGDLRGVIDGAGNTLLPFDYHDIRLEKNGRRRSHAGLRQQLRFNPESGPGYLLDRSGRQCHHTVSV